MGCSRGAATPDAHTQRRLFAASAGYCQNPNCANALFVDAAGKSIHIAEMAHVFSASDGGPHKRFVAVSCQKPALLLAVMLVGAGPVLSPASAIGEEIKESPSNEIGYATVADALAALRSRPGVQISQQGGWTIINEAASSTLWSFTPPEHPAHPSAVKRSIVLKGGSTYIDMKVLCEASKSACDKLVADFQQLNQRMVQSIQGRHSGTATTTPDSPHPPPQTVTTPEQINVTSDSAPGWLPSADQRAQVPQITQDFLGALDGGQYQKAYSLMAESQRTLESFDRFSKRIREFNTEAGAAKERRILKITWTKDPVNAPAPGVYAAVDLASRFENIDRHCGYIVLYQRDSGLPFLVVRQEDNYMTNEHARQIAMTQSAQAVDEIWGRLSRNCPNYTATAR